MTNQTRTILLLGGLSAVLVSFGGMLGPGYLYFFTALAVLMNLGAYFFSDRIVLAMHEAREAAPDEAPRLHAVVEELAVRAEIPKPRVFVIEDAHANAFATGRSPSRGVVAVTTGLVDLLNQRELRGVLAHELAHMKTRDIVASSSAAAPASAITYIASAVQISALFGGPHRQLSTSPAREICWRKTCPMAPSAAWRSPGRWQISPSCFSWMSPLPE